MGRLINKENVIPERCPLEHGLNFISGAWTHQILWFLQADAKRFGDLKRLLQGISAKVLTTRLRELEELGVVNRTVRPTSPPTVEYALTDLGRRFTPVLEALLEVSKGLQRRKPRVVATPAPVAVAAESMAS